MKQRTRISLDARGLIADEHLWTKGTIESTDDPPRRCLSGAICAATKKAMQILLNTTLPEPKLKANEVSHE